MAKAKKPGAPPKAKGGHVTRRMTERWKYWLCISEARKHLDKAAQLIARAQRHKPRDTHTVEHG